MYFVPNNVVLRPDYEAVLFEAVGCLPAAEAQS